MNLKVAVINESKVEGTLRSSRPQTTNALAALTTTRELATYQTTAHQLNLSWCNTRHVEDRYLGEALTPS